MDKTVLVLGGSDYVELFRQAGYTTTTNPDEEYDLICFTGGTDISSMMYNEPRNRHTQASDAVRDAKEEALFNSAVDRQIPIVGICRGAQLICALSGGKLYQHIDSYHQSSHTATTWEGNEMMVTSSHHQMMNPQPLGDDYLVLLSCDNRSAFYEDGQGEVEKPPVDYEAVYFPNTLAVAHQPHPEWMNPKSAYTKFFFETIDELFENRPFTF